MGNAREFPGPIHHCFPALCQQSDAVPGGGGHSSCWARAACPWWGLRVGAGRAPAPAAVGPLALKMELFLSELKRDVSQQPAFLPGSNTSCWTWCPLLSPSDTSEGWGWAAARPGPSAGHSVVTVRQHGAVPVRPHTQGGWSPPLASMFGVLGSVPRKASGTPQLLPGGGFELAWITQRDQGSKAQG